MPPAQLSGVPAVSATTSSSSDPLRAARAQKARGGPPPVSATSSASSDPLRAKAQLHKAGSASTDAASVQQKKKKVPVTRESYERARAQERFDAEVAVLSTVIRDAGTTVNARAPEPAFQRRLFVLRHPRLAVLLAAAPTLALLAVALAAALLRDDAFFDGGFRGDVRAARNAIAFFATCAAIAVAVFATAFVAFRKWIGHAGATAALVAACVLAVGAGVAAVAGRSAESRVGLWLTLALGGASLVAVAVALWIGALSRHDREVMKATEKQLQVPDGGP